MCLERRVCKDGKGAVLRPILHLGSKDLRHFKYFLDGVYLPSVILTQLFLTEK